MSHPRWLALLGLPFWNGQERRLRALWRLVGLAVALGGASWAIGAAGLLPARGSPAFHLAVPGVQLCLGLGGFWLAGCLLDRRGLGDLGLRLDRAWFGDLTFGMCLGALLMSGIFLVELSAGWVRVAGARRSGIVGLSFGEALALMLLLFVAVGILEELLFRGYLLRNLAEGLALDRLGGPRGGMFWAWLLSSGLFAAAHAGNPDATWISTLGVGMAGLFLALGFMLTGQLALPIGLHITWNFFQGNVFGFPVSGVKSLTTTLIVTEEAGPDLWTGGVFGPEAGLLGLGAMLVGTGLTLAWLRLRQGRLALAVSLVAPPRRTAASTPSANPPDPHRL